MQKEILNDITDSEKLLLARRRVGVTQATAAKNYGIPVFQLSAYEQGALDAPEAVLNKAGAKGIKPTDYEKCYLARKREGLTIEQMAARLSVSHVTVINMESGRWNPAREIKYFQAISR